MDLFRAKCVFGLVLIILIVCFTKTAQASTVQCAAAISFQVTPATVSIDQPITISGWVQSIVYTPQGASSILNLGTTDGYCNILGGAVLSRDLFVLVTDNQARLASGPYFNGGMQNYISPLINSPTEKIPLNRYDNTTQYPIGPVTYTPRQLGYKAGDSFTIYARVFALGGFGGIGGTYQTLTDAGPVTIQVTNQTAPQPINPRGSNSAPNSPSTPTSIQPTVLPVTAAPSSHGLVPCGGTNQSPCTVTDIFVLIAQVTDWLVAVAALYAVYEIINNGFWLILSMGNEEVITKRKGGLSNAIVGFVLVMFAFMIINTVVNVLLTTSIATTSNPQCRLELTSPLTYLTIQQDPCSNLPETDIH